MTGRRRLGLVAASATLLAAAPLSAIFDTWTWLLQCILTVALMAGAAVLARTLRFPLWAQTLSMATVLLIVLTWIFPSGEELLSLIPTADTFRHFGELFAQAGQDTRSYGVPVPDRDGLLFITVLGVGGCALVVDLLTVGLRKPALAGLPMLAIYSVPVAVYVDSVPVLPFVVGSIGFLWLLVADNVDRVRRFGRRFTGDGRDVDVWEPSPLAAAGRRLAVIGVAAAVVLPLAVPGLTTGLLSQLTQSGVGTGVGPGVGGSGRVNLFANLSGQLADTRQFDMVRVRTSERDPFYLRFGVADTVTEEGFASRPPAGRSVTRDNTLADPRQGGPGGVTRQQFRATVEVTKNFNMGMAPTYPTVISTDDLNTTWLYDTNAQIVFSNREAATDRSYSFDYVRSLYSPQALRSADPVRPDDEMRQFTTVPEIQEVTDLVTDLTKDAETEYDKVLAIYGHFSAKNRFKYSLQTDTAQSGPQIVAFLNSRVGFCQQYAAAMAWLARAAGIPARVAFGFTRGVQENGTWRLTNKDLHAWTEVYFDGYGWIPFDATPASAISGSSRSPWAPDVDAPSPTATAATPTATGATAAPNTSAGAANDRPRDVDQGAPGAPGSATPSGPSWPAIALIAGIALLVALLAVPALLRRAVRRRRHHATATPQPAVATAPGSRPVEVTTDVVRARTDAHAAWDELVDTMVDYNVRVDPTETPRTTAARLVREVSLTGDPAEAATLLGRAEERARYARKPLQGGELNTALGRIRKALRGSVDRRTRLRAALLPPSVTLRWRLALGDMSAGLVNRLGRAREASARLSPRRLLTNRPRKA